MNAALFVPLMLLAACNRSAVPPTAEETAIAAAERRAIADVDAAHAAAARPAAPALPVATDGTK